VADTGFKLAEQQFDPAIPVESISEHPANPNQGDIGAISESMDAHGFYGAVLVQASTGYILAGNHRYRAARMKGAASVPGFRLDVDDDTAARILAVDNRTAKLASVDEAKLVELLTGAAMAPRGLAGTGYDGDDLDYMIGLLGGNVNPDAGSDGGWAESEEEQAARKQAVDSYNDRSQGGAMVEMILVFTHAARAEVTALTDASRKLIGDSDLRGAEIVVRALRSYHRVLTSRGKAAAEIAAAAGDPVEGVTG
jgi:hypothetical protein